jgi:hypothetical protein
MWATGGGDSVSSGASGIPLSVGLHIFGIRNVMEHKSASLEGLRINLNTDAHFGFKTNKPLQFIDVLSHCIGVRSANIKEVSWKGKARKDRTTGSRRGPRALSNDYITGQKIGDRMSSLFANVVIEKRRKVAGGGRVIIFCGCSIITKGDGIGDVRGRV